VLYDIASTWGKQQELVAPLISVPYTESVKTKEKVTDADGKTRVVEKTYLKSRTAHFLPKTLNIDVSMQDQFRHRGLFKSLVYSADVSVVAKFDALNLAEHFNGVSSIQWDKARITVGLSDTRAINDVSLFEWNGLAQSPVPGTRMDELGSGFHVPLTASASKLASSAEHQLALSMSIKGSGNFLFAPLGETTSVTLDSSWPHPSFVGDALPDQRTITSDGFSASWNIPHLARNYQQRWASHVGETNLEEFSAGVALFEPVSLYSRITRATKYGILFVALTFLTLFLFEVAIKQRLHVVQYALVGVSLSLFFLVLLSLSEHIAFMFAYMISAALTILMISTYVWVALKRFSYAVAVCSLLSLLYGVLYSLLQFEDYALLMGTALLVFLTMVLMFVSRDIQTLEDEQMPNQELAGDQGHA